MDSLVIPNDEWKLQIDRSARDVRISIIDAEGVYRYICFSHYDAARLCRFLSAEQPYPQ